MGAPAIPLMMAMAPLLLAGASRLIGGSVGDRKQKAEEQIFQQALANPFPQTSQPPAEASKSTSTSKSTAGEGGEQPPIDPFNPQTMMQSAILGKPVVLPGLPGVSPVMQAIPPPVAFTQRTVDVPAHRGGGTLTTKPNQMGFQQASTSAHRAHYQAQLKPDGSPKYTPQQIELKSLLGAEYATATQYNTKVDPAKILQIHNALGDIESSYVSAMTIVNDHIENGVPWSHIPALLAEKGILPPPEAFEKLQLSLRERWKARGDQLYANDPTGLADYYRAVDNRFGISAPKPVARVEDLDPKLVSELATRGIAPETPISSLDGDRSPVSGGRSPAGGQPRVGASTIEQAHEASRYHERPRITQEMALNIVGSRSLITGGLMPMFEIMNRRQGDDMTGPFDAVKKVIDKFGIPYFSDQDRVALRGYQDQLMDILYKMRGKQLAVAEIQKAENLMPSTKLDEKSFRTQMDVFTNYVLQTALGNLSTLHRVGIDIGDASIAEVMEHDALQQQFPQGFLYDYLGPYVKHEKTGKKQYIVPE